MRGRILASAAAAAFVVAGCSENGGASQAADATADAAPAPAVEDADAVDLTGAPSGEYITDYKHRYITFNYVHQGFSTPYLRWRDWTGELNWNAEDPEQSSIFVTIDANSIDSGVDEFDGHLRGDSFFDVANHPEITFESTALERTGANTGKLTGDLTIKEITKPVTLDVVINKAQSNEDGSAKIGFSATGVVKRSDYGVDLYVPFIDDDVNLIIETEFVTPPAE